MKRIPALLVAHPQLVSPAFADIPSLVGTANTQRLQKETTEKARTVTTYGTYQVYELGSELVAFDKDILIYYCRYRTEDVLNVPAIVQSIVYRDPNLKSIRGICRWVILDYLLGLTGALATDVMHTADGSKMWLSLMRYCGTAYDTGLCLVPADQSLPIRTYLFEPGDFDSAKELEFDPDLDNSLAQPWSVMGASQGIRFWLAKKGVVRARPYSSLDKHEKQLKIAMLGT